MSEYRWRGGPRDGTYISLGPTDHVVRVAKPINALLFADHDQHELMKIAYIECKVDHELHEVIWPDANWRGYWADERPIITYLSYSISNDDYIKRDQIVQDLVSDTERRMRLDNVLSWSGSWVVCVHNGKETFPRRWRYVARGRRVYCDHDMHGHSSVDARWWCQELHPEFLFERK